MAGTVAGGKKAAAKNLEKDPDFYRRIGAKGGKLGTTGGFASDVLCQCHGKRLPVCAGSKGGKISKRRPGGLAYV